MYEKYAALRDARGLSDYRVAVDCDLPLNLFSEWKYSGVDGRKVTNPKADKLIKLANYFGVPLEYFYKEENGERDQII